MRCPMCEASLAVETYFDDDEDKLSVLLKEIHGIECDLLEMLLGYWKWTAENPGVKTPDEFDIGWVPEKNAYKFSVRFGFCRITEGYFTYFKHRGIKIIQSKEV